MTRRLLPLFLLSLCACVQTTAPEPETASGTVTSSSGTRSSVSSMAWNTDLTPEQLDILHGGTETPFTSPLLNEHRKGTFVSIDCNEPVFRSEQKFDSGTGWPSFWAPIDSGALILREDDSLGMVRTEVLSKCGGHLGHVFDDGPQPTGLRYCMNGAVLKFIPDPGQ